jgi:hypothetical protein
MEILQPLEWIGMGIHMAMRENFLNDNHEAVSPFSADVRTTHQEKVFAGKLANVKIESDDDLFKLILT